MRTFRRNSIDKAATSEYFSQSLLEYVSRIVGFVYLDWVPRGFLGYRQ